MASPRRHVAELHGTNRTIAVAAAERIALTGPPGSGKTALVENLIHGRPLQPGQAAGRLLTDRYAYVPQHSDGLDEHTTALESVQAAAPTVEASAARRQLARVLLRANNANRLISTLTADERFHVCLARILLAGPALDLLAIDEPAAAFDTRSTGQLVEALHGYQGALIVISQRKDFLERLGVGRIIRLDHGGVLSKIQGWTPTTTDTGTNA